MLRHRCKRVKNEERNTQQLVINKVKVLKNTHLRDKGMWFNLLGVMELLLLNKLCLTNKSYNLSFSWNV